ncbi:MAG: type 1 glutamine amidotransferase [candidate division NC10 bacterium]|nr:type 1 glutamine amidotransferase [candidate division NC10 bacterium]
MNFLVLQHVDCEDMGLWEDCCREAGIALEMVALHREAPIPPPHRFQAVISLGGPMNVYEEETYPFLKAEDDFIRRVVSNGIPFLGICLGGQLLAKAVGGRVTRNPVKEIGWHAVELEQPGQRDPLFAGLPDRLPVFQWHGDMFSLPGGAVRLARSDACQNQAFRFGFGGIAYALQFHLEVTPRMIDRWVHTYRADLDGTADPAQMREQAPARCAALLPVARRVFKNFTRLVQLRGPGVGAQPVDRPPQPARRRSARDLTVEQAWQRYRELMARGKLRCGVTCPLDRIGRCTGGCW